MGSFGQIRWLRACFIHIDEWNIFQKTELRYLKPVFHNLTKHAKNPRIFVKIQNPRLKISLFRLFRTSIFFFFFFFFFFLILYSRPLKNVIAKKKKKKSKV